MLTEIFKTILLLSVSGTAVFLFLLLIKPLTERKFGAVWQYYIWITVIVIMIIPFKIKIPLNTSVEASQKVYEAIGVIEQVRVKTVDLSVPEEISRFISFDISDIIAILWFAVAAVIIFMKTVCYFIFKRNICKNSVFEAYKGRVQLRRAYEMSSPLLTGLIRPILVIPDEITDESEMNHILAHELLHYKRYDILYKWVTVFVKSVHWFNPFVYILAKEIDKECEISCDVVLTKEMNEDEKKLYMNTVLQLIKKSSVRKFALFASMASNKKIIKKRFKMIRDFKKIRISVRLASVSVAAVIVVLGVAVGSACLSLPTYAEKGTPEKTVTYQYARTETKPASDIPPEEEKTEKEDETNLAEVAAEPEIVSEEELTEKLPEIKKNMPSSDGYVNMEILEFSEKQDIDSMLLLVEKSESNYIYGKFGYEDGTERYVHGIKPDENGNITLYLSSDIDEIIQVDFWDDENQNGVWGVKIPACKDRVYSFTGFDTEKTYSVRLYSASKENWKIDSEYIIY